MTIYEKLSRLLAKNGAIVKIRDLYELIENETNLEVVVNQCVAEVFRNGAITLFEPKDSYSVLLNIQLEAVEKNENSSLDSLVEIKNVLISVCTKRKD